MATKMSSKMVEAARNGDFESFHAAFQESLREHAQETVFGEAKKDKEKYSEEEDDEEYEEKKNKKKYSEDEHDDDEEEYDEKGYKKDK